MLTGAAWRPRHRSDLNALKSVSLSISFPASTPPRSSLCRLLPWESIVTIAGKITNVEVPHRFGRAELEQRHAGHALDAARVELGRAADGVQVDGA